MSGCCAECRRSRSNASAVFYIYRYGSFQEIKMTAQKNQKWYGIPIPYHFGPENQDVVLATTVVHTACRTRARRGAPASAATRAHTDPATPSATPCQCSHCITVHAHSLRRGRGRDERAKSAGCEETGAGVCERAAMDAWRAALSSAQQLTLDETLLRRGVTGE